MRKALVVLVIALFCSGVNLGYAQDLTLGFIDLRKVMNEYEKVRDGEGQLQKELEEKNKQKEKLTEEIKKLREKIDFLNDEQKENKQQELAEKVKKLQEFNYQMRIGLQQKRDEKLRNISKDIKDVVQEYAQSRNYNIIFDKMLLHYGDSKIDVTDDVIKILNQRYKK